MILPLRTPKAFASRQAAATTAVEWGILTAYPSAIWTGYYKFAADSPRDESVRLADMAATTNNPLGTPNAFALHGGQGDAIAEHSRFGSESVCDSG